MESEGGEGHRNGEGALGLQAEYLWSPLEVGISFISISLGISFISISLMKQLRFRRIKVTQLLLQRGRTRTLLS